MSGEAKSAEAKPAGGSSGYSLGRAQGKCSACGGDLAAGEKFTAAVRESPGGLERLDLHTACAANIDRASLLAFWQATHRPAAAKPKVFVDDAVLCDLFDRLGDSGDEPDKVNFRFVLGLILMRKRLLVYESSHIEGQKEFWNVRLKGREEPIALPNPRLDEQQVAQVSSQLTEILSGDSA